MLVVYLLVAFTLGVISAFFIATKLDQKIIRGYGEALEQAESRSVNYMQMYATSASVAYKLYRYLYNNSTRGERRVAQELDEKEEIFYQTLQVRLESELNAGKEGNPQS